MKILFAHREKTYEENVKDNNALVSDGSWNTVVLLYQNSVCQLQISI